MIETWQQALPHGITLSCRASGQRGRPVLLFLHGFPEAAFVWDPLLNHFSQPEHGGYRCIAPNLRGYEHSSAPQGLEHYRARALLQDLQALIDVECGPTQALAALVAHDWGGALAWALANHAPERMRRLVILNAPHPGTFVRELRDSPAQRQASDYMNFLIRPDAAALLSANGYRRLFGFFEAMGASARPGSAQAPDGAGWLDEAMRAKYRAVWDLGLEGGLNYYRASPLRASPDGASNLPELPAALLHIAVPTLVLWAQNDTALLPGLTQGLEAFVPELKLVPIARATHWLVHEQPARVIAEISGFLPPAQ